MKNRYFTVHCQEVYKFEIQSKCIEYFTIIPYMVIIVKTSNYVLCDCSCPSLCKLGCSQNCKISNISNTYRYYTTFQYKDILITIVKIPYINIK